MGRKRPPPRRCFVCGCTDLRACPGGCAWDEARGRTARGEDLSVCTACTRTLSALDRLAKRLKISAKERIPYELGALSMLRLVREAERSRAPWKPSLRPSEA